MTDDRFRTAAVAAGIAGLSWAVADYRPTAGVACAVLAVALLCWATRRRPLVPVMFSATVCLVLWAAFGTAEGYFLLNRHRLEALVAEIEAIPAITSIELGTDDRTSHGGRETGRFDSYRFINGQLVTQYREQVAPDASQPVLREIDVLRDLGVPAARYQALRASLDRLSLAGFGRLTDGEIALHERMPGGMPWGSSFVFRRSAGPLLGERINEQRQLAPHWFHITQG